QNTREVLELLDSRESSTITRRVSRGNHFSPEKGFTRICRAFTTKTEVVSTLICSNNSSVEGFSNTCTLFLPNTSPRSRLTALSAFPETTVVIIPFSPLKFTAQRIRLRKSAFSAPVV